MPEPRVDYVHTGPGMLCGRYLRRWWHPVYRAQELPAGRALPIRILGEDLTLYRGEDGTPHVVAFRCAHRGTQLSVGWVEDDCIRCRYHGWKYDASGQCVEQPGEDPASAARVRIRAYPSREYLGLVFAYLGEGDPPPFRHFPDMDLPGVLETDPPEAWPCNFFNRLDNDPAHVPWTHRNTLIRMNDTAGMQPRDVTGYVETPWGLTTGANGARVGNHFLMPNVNLLRVRSKTPGYHNRGWWEYRLIFHVPIDDEHSVAFDVNLTPLPEEEREAYRAARRAAQETDDPYPYQAAAAILAGKMRIEDVDPELSYYQQFWIEDYSTQVGQGTVADRSNEVLARTDERVVLKRMLFERELLALEHGRPLKEWITPPLFAALNDNGVQRNGA